MAFKSVDQESIKKLADRQAEIASRCRAFADRIASSPIMPVCTINIAFFSGRADPVINITLAQGLVNNAEVAGLLGKIQHDFYCMISNKPIDQDTEPTAPQSIT